MKVARWMVGVGALLLARPAESNSLCPGNYCGWTFEVASITLVSGDPDAEPPEWLDKEPVVSTGPDGSPYRIDFGNTSWVPSR